MLRVLACVGLLGLLGGACGAGPAAAQDDKAPAAESWKGSGKQGAVATRALLKELQIKPAVLGFPVEFRKDDATFERDLENPDDAAQFAKALGLELDLNGRGMGTRSQRYALVADDGKVTHLGVEAPGGFEASKAETILAAL